MSPPFPPTDPDADERAAIVFFEALRRNLNDRGTFLDEACGTDTALRAEVEALLRDHESAGSFLSGDSPLHAELGMALPRLKPEQPGEPIGPYKLLEQIGEGGFGTVWVAEQEKPVRRRVALKIIKPGMDTKAVIARFEQERQALAMMDHPNIASVIDAGATSLGRPYFVMELVRGIKITQYCDQANLPTSERLRLFIAVCHAVQHAHQKGIIHRDLKPSNILVTLHDGVPVPKVIDFGVAKATQQQRLTELTIYTQFEQMIGTPLYMSPEQAEMSALDIDTRSDIYSLGVLLYELLAGRTPFDPESLMKRGLDEIRRVVREHEPVKPSTFISTMALDLRTTVARHRQTDNVKLIGQIRGDLDWIVMKALEKDRSRRYETANSFAEDIQRHLLCEPVQARPPTHGYRFRRFARRNRAAFAAGTAILVALLAGLAVSTWMFLKEKDARKRAVAAEIEQARLRRLAEDQEKKATTEAIKSEQVTKFIEDMLEGVGPSVALGRDTTMLREIVDKTVKQVGSDLKDQPEVEAELRSIIGNVCLDLGEYGKAEALYSEALQLRRSLFAEEHVAVADSLYSMARVLEPTESETMHREALRIRKKLLGDDHPDVARSMNAIALSLRLQGKHGEAEIMAGSALAIMRKQPGGEQPEVADIILTLAQAVGHQGRYVESGELHGEGLKILRNVYGNEHPKVAETLLNLSQNLRSQHRLAESETLNREALEIGRKLYPTGHPKIIDIQQHLIQVLAIQGKLDEAVASERKELERQKKLLGDGHPDLAPIIGELAMLLRRQYNLAEAESMQKEALAITRKSTGVSPLNLAYQILKLAEILYRENKFIDSYHFYREGLAIMRTPGCADNDDLLGWQASFARLLADWAWAERNSRPPIGENGAQSQSLQYAQEAERILRECLTTRQSGPNPNHSRTHDACSRLGGALLSVAVTDSSLTSEARLSKLVEAESFLLKGNEALQNSENVNPTYKRDSLTRLVRLYEAWEKPEKTAEWQAQLDDFDKQLEQLKSSQNPPPQ